MSVNTVKYRDRYIKRAARILPVIQVGVPFAPSAIDQIVGGAYSSKFVFYLRELGFEFTQQKDGRKIVSYTLVKEPADVATIRGASPSKTRSGAKSATKVAAKSAVTTETEVSAPVKKTSESKAKKTSAKKVAAAKKSAPVVARGGNAANLAKLKEIGKKFKKMEREDREAFLTEDVPATSFSLDGDWDSVEGLDLSKLL